MPDEREKEKKRENLCVCVRVKEKDSDIERETFQQYCSNVAAISFECFTLSGERGNY